MKSRYENNGFTLVELMVALLIGAIVLGYAIPSFNSLMRKQELVAQLSSLNSAFAFARAEAIARSEAVGICGSTDGINCSNSTDWDSGWVIYLDSDRGTPLRVEDDLAGQVTLRSEVSEINFNRDGELIGLAGVKLSLCAGDAEEVGEKRSRTINVSVVGSSRVDVGGSCPNPN